MTIYYIVHTTPAVLVHSVRPLDPCGACVPFRYRIGVMHTTCKVPDMTQKIDKLWAQCQFYFAKARSLAMQDAGSAARGPRGPTCGPLCFLSVFLRGVVATPPQVRVPGPIMSFQAPAGGPNHVNDQKKQQQKNIKKQLVPATGFKQF